MSLPVKSFSKNLDPRLKKMRSFGGPLLKKSNAKTARPVSTKHVMHLVLRSSQARDAWSFSSSKNRKIITEILKRRAKEAGIRMVDFANGGNHLHLLLRTRSREAFQRFVRTVTGDISMRLTGACKGQELRRQFWDFRPWTGIFEDFRRSANFLEDFILDHFKILKLIPMLNSDYRRTLIREGPWPS